MRTAVWIACGVLALVPCAGAQAQTKLAGKMSCGKPDLNHSAPVGDQPNHSIGLSAMGWARWPAATSML